MCLTLREKDSDKPYDDSDIRWKTIRMVEQKFYSMFGSNLTMYEDIGKENIAKDYTRHFMETREWDIGFHVFVERETARNYTCRDSLYVKVKVEGFIASGYENPCIGLKTETWKKMTILEIYDNEGNNVTEKYK